MLVTILCTAALIPYHHPGGQWGRHRVLKVQQTECTVDRDSRQIVVKCQDITYKLPMHQCSVTERKTK